MQKSITTSPSPREFSAILIKDDDREILKTDIIAVIPAFNMARVIGSTVLSIKQHVGKVIVIDDGSSDHTADIAKTAGAEVIRLDNSLGRTYALLVGLRRAREQKCAIAVCIDASGKYDPREIGRVSGKIATGEADLVIGSRYLHRDSFLSPCEKYDQMRLGSGAIITDLTSSFHAFSKNALENLDFQSDGFRPNRDLITFFDRKGLKISEVPVTLNLQPIEPIGWGIPIKVLAGMPAFNEEKYIARTIIGAQKYVDHVVVVDDGSTDATHEIAEKLGAIVVRHEKNSGYGAAIRSIFEKARELHVDALVIIDSDGQHDPRDIETLVERLGLGDVDVVIGSRFVYRKKQDIPKYRVFGMKVLDRFTRFAGAESNTDSQSGFRAYGERAINSIRISGTGMSVGSEILIQIAENKLKIADVPIDVRYDIEETSSQNPFVHGISVIYNLIGLVSYRRPLPAFGIPGLFLVIVGIITGSSAFSEYYITTKFPFVLSMVSAVFLIMGLLLVIGALILNYLVLFVKDQNDLILRSK
jgi:glycosyltransferase involved in cell wall biosynthesis